jgi:site-specific recombinase XerD
VTLAGTCNYFLVFFWQFGHLYPNGLTIRKAMARTPKLNWKEVSKGKWQVDVPPSISETGKRERHFFTTRDKAKAHAQELREKFLAHGGQAAAIKPSLAEAAIAAEAILAPWGAGLVEAAKHFAAVKEREAASKPVAEATAAFLLACEGLRDRTIEGYRHACRRLDAALGERLLATLTAEEIAVAAEVNTPGAAAANRYRCARAFWRWAAKKGWCDAATFAAVESPRVSNDGEISVLTVAEAEALLRTAEEHYPQAVASYALQLFAGIRVEELVRLKAENVTAEGVELGASVTKKNRRRHITPSPALSAWLARYPFAPCPNWGEVHKACRRLAGWRVASRLLSKPPKPTRGAWPQNVLRHSFASYAIANGSTLEEMLFTFGHAGGPALLRSNYVGKVTKKAALEFFALRPEGEQAEAKPQLETVESPAA